MRVGSGKAQTGRRNLTAEIQAFVRALHAGSQEPEDPELASAGPATVGEEAPDVVGPGWTSEPRVPRAEGGRPGRVPLLSPGVDLGEANNVLYVVEILLKQAPEYVALRTTLVEILRAERKLVADVECGNTCGIVESGDAHLPQCDDSVTVAETRLLLQQQPLSLWSCVPGLQSEGFDRKVRVGCAGEKGRGVFAVRNLQRGEILCFYPAIAVGDIPSSSLPLPLVPERTPIPMSYRAEETPPCKADLDKYIYIWRTARDRKRMIVADGSSEELPYVAHLINDAASCAGPEEESLYLATALQKVNVDLVAVEDACVLAVAIRDIESGDELLMCYGVEYWRKTYEGPPATEWVTSSTDTTGVEGPWRRVGGTPCCAQPANSTSNELSGHLPGGADCRPAP